MYDSSDQLTSAVLCEVSHCILHGALRRVHGSRVLLHASHEAHNPANINSVGLKGCKLPVALRALLEPHDMGLFLRVHTGAHTALDLLGSHFHREVLPSIEIHDGDAVTSCAQL